MGLNTQNSAPLSCACNPELTKPMVLLVLGVTKPSVLFRRCYVQVIKRTGRNKTSGFVEALLGFASQNLGQLLLCPEVKLCFSYLF